MEANNSAGAAMAASASGKLRPGFVPSSTEAREKRKGELLATHLAGGGTINAFARIHRMTTAAVGALRATLTYAGPIARTGGKPKGSISASTWKKMDALAEIVAERDCTVKEAGEQLGMPQQSASRLWSLIRRELGEQAV